LLRRVQICLFIPAFKDGVVNGAVLIVHQIHEGKHLYNVENVVKYKKGSEKKKFFRYNTL